MDSLHPHRLAYLISRLSPSFHTYGESAGREYPHAGSGISNHVANGRREAWWR